MLKIRTRPMRTDQLRRNGLWTMIRLGQSKLALFPAGSPHPPCQHRGRVRQVERLRGLFVLPFAFRFFRVVAMGGVGAAAFRTSSTTSCHQCSAGALSSPSSRWRVSANVGSWCHPSQSARVLHVPTITRLSSLSTGRRSCPPTQPGRFLAADRRLRMTASQSRPAPGFRCTCVTIVFIGKSPGLLVGHCQFHSITSSARASTEDGGRGPSALVVLILTVDTNGPS